VLRLLNQVGADLGEQINVVRTWKGAVHVRAVVETRQRKLEILRALKPVADEPAVVIEVLTALEAPKLQPRQQASNATSVQQVEPTDDRLPVDSELRRYLANSGGKEGEELEAEIMRFAVRVSAHSRLSLQHAWAVQRLAGRFSTNDFDALNRDAELKWLAMVRQHSATIRRETAALRQQLRPVFGSHENSYNSVLALEDPDLKASARRLLDACTTIDAMVRSAFSLSTGPSASEIKSSRFWDALQRAQLYAERSIAPPKNFRTRLASERSENRL
jgi:hypothetical protein